MFKHSPATNLHSKIILALSLYSRIADRGLYGRGAYTEVARGLKGALQLQSPLKRKAHAEQKHFCTHLRQAPLVNVHIMCQRRKEKVQESSSVR